MEESLIGHFVTIRLKGKFTSKNSKAYIPLQCLTTRLRGLLWAIPPTRDFHAGCTCFKTTFSGQQVSITQNRISNALDQKQPHFV